MEEYEKGNWRYDYGRAVLQVTDSRDRVLECNVSIPCTTCPVGGLMTVIYTLDYPPEESVTK